MNNDKLRKPWWVPKSKAILEQFAKASGGSFIPASFSKWKYTGQHVRVELNRGRGYLSVALSDSGSESSHLVTQIRYDVVLRRKLQFRLCAIKRPIFTPFHTELKSVSMPNAAMQKKLHAKSTHPSVFRQVLKFEGLQEALDQKPNAVIALKAKGQRYSLTLTETSKKPDIESLQQGVHLMKLMISALESQGVIRIPDTARTRSMHAKA